MQSPLFRRLSALALSLGLLVPLTGCVSYGAAPSGQAGSAPAVGKSLDLPRPGSDGRPSPADADPSGWTIVKAPDYYTVAGPAELDGVDLPAPGRVEYAAPDALGRTGRAVAVIDMAGRSAGSSRERDMPDTITGWPGHNPVTCISFTVEDTCRLPQRERPDGTYYHGRLFNRSHLIAKSLGGADTPDNMVTGTRTQNVGRNQPAGGMAYTESQARDWLFANPDGTIDYVVTPRYNGDELLPRTVEVDMRTSDGVIDEHVVVYNAANGHDIDYAHGGERSGD